jgi:hypothetical protein
LPLNFILAACEDLGVPKSVEASKSLMMESKAFFPIDDAFDEAIFIRLRTENMAIVGYALPKVPCHLRH